jgi:hypothetical protein
MMQKYKDRKDLKQILLRMKLRIDCSSSDDMDDSTPTFSNIGPAGRMPGQSKV